jgi:hypothetical protein
LPDASGGFRILLLLLLLLFGRIDHPYKANTTDNEKDNEDDDDCRAGWLWVVGYSSLSVRGATKKGQAGKESGHDAFRLLNNELFPYYAWQTVHVLTRSRLSAE